MDAASILRRARLRAGLSLRQLAALAETSHSALAAYEAARVTPNVETSDRVLSAAGFNASLSHAFGGALALAWCTERARGTTAFHVAAADRAVVHEFAAHDVPFLCCSDVTVFKAFDNRTQDCADLEEMVTAGTLDGDLVLGALVHYLGHDDERVARLTALLTTDA